MRQVLAAPVRGCGKPVPAGCRPGRVGILPTGWGGDFAILEGRSELVANTVERRDHIARIAAGLCQDRIDCFLIEIAVDAVGERGFQAGGMLERERDIGDWSAVIHDRLIYPRPKAGQRTLSLYVYEPGR